MIPVSLSSEGITCPLVLSFVFRTGAGGFIEFASRYIDPAAGFAMGWQFWFQTAMTAPVEIVAASIVIQYWDHNDDHLGIYVGYDLDMSA